MTDEGTRADAAGTELDFPVEGMTCGSCAARVQKTLGGSPVWPRRR